MTRPTIEQMLDDLASEFYETDYCSRQASFELAGIAIKITHQSAYAVVADEIASLQQENKRLREALEKIKEEMWPCDGTYNGTCSKCTAYSIATKALQPSKSEDK